MAATDAVSRAEAEIDAAFAASKLADLGFAQAVWTLLSVNEDYFIKALHQLPPSQLHVFADVHLNALTHPLRVCFGRGNREAGRLRNDYNGDHYQLAWDWIEAAIDYGEFCTIFPLWHRGRVTIAIEDSRLIVDNRSNDRKEYEAYNRLVRKEGRPPPSIPPAPDGFVDFLVSRATVKADWFRLNFNPQLVSRLVSMVSPAMAVRHTLPPDWQFGAFSLQQYRKVMLPLQAMLYGWHAVRSVLANSGMQGLGYRSSVWVVAKDELLARLRRYTDLNAGVIGRILDLITFGSNGIRHPDIAIQPLIDLDNGSYALAPFVWLNTNIERNLCMLLNQIPQERHVYSRLVTNKETATRTEITAALSSLGLDFRWGQVADTDLDLAIIDRRNKVCLCLELKWFIEPDEIREIEQRTKELVAGVGQAKKIKALFDRTDDRLVHELLNIDSGYLFLTAVASQNWIGFGDVQDAAVPIIKVWHLVNRFKETGSLVDTVNWLKARAYLPKEGIDFRIRPVERTCGKWRATWYGVEVLASETGDA